MRRGEEFRLLFLCETCVRLCGSKQSVSSVEVLYCAESERCCANEQHTSDTESSSIA